MRTKSGAQQGYAHFLSEAELTSHQNQHRTLKSRSPHSRDCFMKRDSRTDREYFWQWQDKSWNKGKNREAEEKLTHLQQRNPSLAPNLHVNNCYAKHINTSQLFSLRALHMIESLRDCVLALYFQDILHSFYIYITHPTQGLVLYSICNLHLGNIPLDSPKKSAIPIWCPDHPYMENSSVF